MLKFNWLEIMRKLLWGLLMNNWYELRLLHRYINHFNFLFFRLRIIFRITQDFNNLFSIALISFKIIMLQFLLIALIDLM